MTTRTFAVLTLLFVFVSAPTWADEKANTSAASGKMTTDEEKTSYALGNTIGKQLVQMLKANSTEVVAKYFAIAIQDVLENNTPALPAAELSSLMQALDKATNERRMAQQTAMSSKNKTAGTAYLAANKTKEGVSTTASGLQYKVIKEGTGPMPKATDKVKVHYKGTFIDGKEFDSSYAREQPAQFPLNGVIKGWTEGLQLMKVGAKYEFAIPYNLAYGEQGRPGSIPPASTLLFEVELLEIIK